MSNESTHRPRQYTPSSAAKPSDAIAASSMPPARRPRSKWSILREPAFIATAAVLLTAALGLNVVTASMHLYFKKQPVPLRAQLDTIPDQFGPWVCVSKTETLGNELEETLGTKQFIFRDYVNSTIVPQSRIDEFKDKPLDRQQKMLGALIEQFPNAVINCAVTYYTGKADTVAHIPDRCYTASGFEPTSYEIKKWNVATPITQEQDDGKLEVRFITFDDTTGTRSIPTNVAYFFHCDARYESDPASVRVTMSNLFNRYAYYAKVELKIVTPEKAKCEQAMTDFLSHALPEIEKPLPSKQSLAELNRSSK